jgi:shikimate kinase
MKVYLVGYMASGKSTTGRALAESLAVPFLDTDDMIEQEQGKTISTIFHEAGEEAFREMERGILEKTVSIGPSVIATGGGLPCHGSNMDVMNRHGLTVFLDVLPETVIRRLKQESKGRPLLSGLSGNGLAEFIRSQMSVRRKHYLCAQVILDADVLTAAALESAIRPYFQSR